MAAAIDALEGAFRANELGDSPQRLVVQHDGAHLLAMPAAGADAVGVKLVTVQPANRARGLPGVHGVFALFAGDTMAPVALIDGAELTSIRTSAVSAVATKHLARADASRLVVFGAGVQARAHVEAMRAVRDISELTVVARRPEAAQELVRELSADGIRVLAGEPATVREADIVCTCTGSPTPLFEGASLAAGAHVNAIGSFQPHTREVDTATCVRARIAVEDRGAVLAEAGDLLIPLAEGAITGDEVLADLSGVVRGATVRRDESDVTLFKSVGVASEDLVVASVAFARLAP